MTTNATPANLIQGIQLVQAGRHAEALAYLRHAVRTESVTVEGWLWLAAATTDRAEYRHCVNQALNLDPYHHTAQRMRDALARQDHAAYPVHPQPVSYPSPAPNFAPPATGHIPDYILSPDEFATLREDEITATRVQQPSRLRRLIRLLALVVLLGGCGGVLASMIASGVIQDMTRNWLASGTTHTLDFTVSEAPAYHFRVKVPESWLPANTDNPSWRTTRDDLIAQFPPTAGQTAIWEQIDVSFSKTVRDPVYGDMLPAIRLVETDPDQLAQSGTIATLTLTKIVPYPNTTPSSAPEVCDRMRGLEAAYLAGQLSLPPGGIALETTLAARAASDDCIFAAQRRYTMPGSFTPALLPDHALETVRLVWIAIPIEAERYAVWLMVMAETDYEYYERSLEHILHTLTNQP